MKTRILFLFILLFIISCSKTNEDILNKVSSNINNIKTIKYLSVMEVQDNGQVVHKSEDTLSFDFSNDLKYHFNNEYGEMIYNGKKNYSIY